MFIKSFAALGVVVGGALYAFGAFDAFPATVDGPPETVMAELIDLDVRELPGEPGTTAAAAGGVMPRFVTLRGDNMLEWRVMSGDKIATRMVATFEPVDEGTRTRITPFVERGDAPENFTSPAFRSEGLTMGLFQAALQAEIDEMVAPGWGPECDDLRDDLLYGPMPAGADVTNSIGAEGSDAREIAQGMSEGLSAISRLRRMHSELMKAGCNPDKAPGSFGGEFRRVDESMSFEGGGDGGWASDPIADDLQEDAGWGGN